LGSEIPVSLARKTTPLVGGNVGLQAVRFTSSSERIFANANIAKVSDALPSNSEIRTSLLAALIGAQSMTTPM
jgi:hypothetical protein